MNNGDNVMIAAARVMIGDARIVDINTPIIIIVWGIVNSYIVIIILVIITIVIVMDLIVIDIAHCLSIA